MFKALILIALTGLSSSSSAQAALSGIQVAKMEIIRLYPGSRVELPESELPEVATAAREIRPGIVEITAMNGTSSRHSFQVYKKAWIALHRIKPGEALKNEDFQIEEVSLLDPMTRDIQGLILKVDESLDKLEARNTILAGQFPLTSGVQKMPDARRGDVVTIKVQSGELVLTSSGMIQEPKRIGESVRVTTQKTKKELTGVLREGGVVEVTL